MTIVVTIDHTFAYHFSGISSKKGLNRRINDSVLFKIMRFEQPIHQHELYHVRSSILHSLE